MEKVKEALIEIFLKKGYLPDEAERTANGLMQYYEEFKQAVLIAFNV